MVAVGRTRTDSCRLKRPVPDPLGDDGTGMPSFVCECGSGRTRTCDGRWAQTGLQPASFAARMHAPLTRSCNSFPIAWLTSRNEKSRRGFPGRLHFELSLARV